MKRKQKEVEVLITLGPALIATRGYAAPEVEQTYTRALTLCQEMASSPYLFMALRGLWNCYLDLGLIFKRLPSWLSSSSRLLTVSTIRCS